MKQFKTISEYEILVYAYNNLLDKFFREEKNNDDLSNIKCAKYKEQMDEIKDRLLEIECNK